MYLQYAISTDNSRQHLTEKFDLALAVSDTSPSPEHSLITPSDARKNRSEVAPSDDWNGAALQQIAERELKPSRDPSNGQERYKLLNRAHGLTSRIDGDEWTIEPHDAGGVERREWQWRYRLSEVVRGRSHTKLSSGDVRVENDTVTIARSPQITEWYKNKREGFEQGFEISERAHAGVGGDLILRGVVATNLTTRNPNRDAIAFFHNGKQELNYAGLKVTDSAGAVVPAWFSYANTKQGGTLDIHIDDASAVYPLSVDPVASSASWTGESNQADASFGWGVSTAGDVNGDGYSDVLVSASLYDNGQTNESQVYLYLGSSSGLATTKAWSFESGQAAYGFLGDDYLYPTAATAGDVDGDGYSDVIVAFSGYNNGETDEGQAYLFLGSSSGLATTSAWTQESNQTLAYYGISANTAGDVNGDGYSDVVVGAYLFDNGESNEGRAFVYHGSSSGLATTTAWTGESNQAAAGYGNSVSTAGDINGDGYSDIIVGASTYNNGQNYEGQAYVYHGSSSGLATTTAWTGESNQASAYYGESVSTAGDLSLIHI